MTTIKINQTSLSTLTLLFLSIAYYSNPAPLAAAEQAPSQETMETWFENLSTDDVDIIEKAKKAFQEAGPVCNEFLKKKSEDSDPDIKALGTKIIGMIKSKAILDQAKHRFTTDKGISGKMAFYGKAVGQQIKGTATFKNMPAQNKTFTTSHSEMMGQKIESKITSDGITSWTRARMNGGPAQIYKASLKAFGELSQTSSHPSDFCQMIIQLQDMYDFSSQKGNLGGESVWILDGIIKPGTLERKVKEIEAELGPMIATQMKIALEKQKHQILYLSMNGIPRKLDQLTDDGEIGFSTTFSDLKFDQVFDEKIFAYSPPSGAAIIDMGKMIAEMREKAPNQESPEKEASPGTANK